MIERAREGERVREREQHTCSHQIWYTHIRCRSWKCEVGRGGWAELFVMLGFGGRTRDTVVHIVKGIINACWHIIGIDKHIRQAARLGYHAHKYTHTRTHFHKLYAHQCTV